MHTHTFSAFSFRDAVAGRTADELAYMTVSEITYGEKQAQRRTVVESVPWTLEAMRARGCDVPDGASLTAQADAMATVAQNVAAANTLTGRREWEAAVFAPKGSQRLVSRRFSCEIYGGVSADGGGDDGYLTPPDDNASLEAADAMSAAPGLRAITGGVQRLVDLTDRGIAFVLKHMQTAEVMWQRNHSTQQAIIDALRAENAELRAQVTHLTELLLEDDERPAPVPPEMFQEAASEVGSTLKMALSHWLGSGEVAGLFDTVKALPDDVKKQLADPKTTAALKRPEVIETFRHIIANLPEGT